MIILIIKIFILSNAYLIRMKKFLSELTRMFNLNREENGSSLYITMKKYRQKIGAEPKAKEKKGKANKKLVIKETKPQERKIIFSEDNKCIIRAKIGHKKISTIINAKDLDKFQAVGFLI